MPGEGAVTRRRCSSKVDRIVESCLENGKAREWKRVPFVSGLNEFRAHQMQIRPCTTWMICDAFLTIQVYMTGVVHKFQSRVVFTYIPIKNMKVGC